MGLIPSLDSDDLDDFLEYDATLGSDVAECPKCGKKIGVSLVCDSTIECPDCGHRFEPGM
jgi:DNA-directed RNA polymerase subunit RPC12/RpoP